MRPIAIGVAMIVAFGWASVTAHAQSWKPPAETSHMPLLSLSAVFFALYQLMGVWNKNPSRLVI